ncbi:MAG: hypothetical protein PHR35_07800 [Kiritimatiellae bacterium]|nr:hypothetical protein [Kiritimatiellia bacterium]
MEQGKDILAVGPDGTPAAFQLKSGNLTLKDWRHPDHSLKGQVEDLLDLPIDHPSVGTTRPHRSFLVTTGNLDDALRQELTAYNRGRRAKHKRTLIVWVKDQLSQKLVTRIGCLLPQRLDVFRDFLRLYLADGRSCPDGSVVSKFYEDATSLTGDPVRPNLVASELVLLAALLSEVYRNQSNHIACIDVWTLAAAQLLRLSGSSAKILGLVRPSILLAETAIWQAMRDLVAEIGTRQNYIEGSPFSDAFVYRARITRVAGTLSAVLLWDKWLNGTSTCDDTVRAFLEAHRNQMWLWGEGAVPSFLACGWAADLLGLRPGAEGEAAQIAKLTTLVNHDRRRGEDGQAEPWQRQLLAAYPRGLPDPYVSIEHVISDQIDRLRRPMEVTYAGQSYALESLVHLLARHLNRKLLATLWSDVSHVAFATFEPENHSDLWRWHNAKGEVVTRYTDNPTSWSRLKASASTWDPALMPPGATQCPHMLLLWLMLAPHRINAATVTFLDQVEWDSEANHVERRT